MSIHMRAVCTLFLTAAVSGLGCSASTPTEGGEAENVATSTSSEALSVYQWSPDSQAGNNSSWNNPSIATWANGSTTYTFMVHGDSDGTDHSLYWSTSSNGVTWGWDENIPDMYASESPQIVSFNGNLYMLHIGDHDDSVWMSRFNPGTWTWNHDFLTPFHSTHTPSLASFNGALYIIGMHATGQVWQATMSTSEIFSAASDLPGIVSTMLSPSLTVQCGFGGSLCLTPTLYMAYLNAGQVTMSGLQIPRRGTPAWWTPWVVMNADGTPKKTTRAPALASFAGNLHMVYIGPGGGDHIMWTYYDGYNWSPDVSIAGQEMWTSASLAARPGLLVMAHGSSYKDHQNNNVPVYAEYFQ